MHIFIDDSMIDDAVFSNWRSIWTLRLSGRSIEIIAYDIAIPNDGTLLNDRPQSDNTLCHLSCFHKRSFADNGIHNRWVNDLRSWQVMLPEENMFFVFATIEIRVRCRQCNVGFKKWFYCSDIFPVSIVGVNHNIPLAHFSWNQMFAKIFSSITFQ